MATDEKYVIKITGKGTLDDIVKSLKELVDDIDKKGRIGIFDTSKDYSPIDFSFAYDWSSY